MRVASPIVRVGCMRTSLTRLLVAAVILGAGLVVTPFGAASSRIVLVVNRARTNEAREHQMSKWHARGAHLVAAMAVVMSALLISGGPVPTVDAAPSGFHDTAWTAFSQSAVSRYLDPASGFQYGVYSVAVEWQGKSTTPLTAPSVGDVFYVHIYTEVSNVWKCDVPNAGADARRAAAGEPNVRRTTSTAKSATSTTSRSGLMGECAAPYMSGGYATFPAVSSGVNERLHFWFPVTATQAMSGTAGDMQVLSDQTNAPAVSLPNPTLTTTRLLVVSPSPSAPAAPTGLSAAAGNGSATISFTAGSNGGFGDHELPVLVERRRPWTSLSPADTTSPVTITGLTNGTTYNVQLRAVSTIVGAASASATVSLPPIALPPIIVIPPIIFPPIIYVPPPYTPPSTPPPSAGGGGGGGGSAGGGTRPERRTGAEDTRRSCRPVSPTPGFRTPRSTVLPLAVGRCRAARCWWCRSPVVVVCRLVRRRCR